MNFFSTFSVVFAFIAFSPASNASAADFRKVTELRSPVLDILRDHFWEFCVHYDAEYNTWNETRCLHQAYEIVDRSEAESDLQVVKQALHYRYFPLYDVTPAPIACRPPQMNAAMKDVLELVRVPRKDRLMRKRLQDLRTLFAGLEIAPQIRAYRLELSTATQEGRGLVLVDPETAEIIEIYFEANL